MKVLALLPAILVFCCTRALALDIPTDSTATSSAPNRINFYLVNKPKSLDLFSRLVIWRARKQGMKQRDKLIIVVATSSKEAADKMIDYLQKKKARIGTLWIDSHGHYANGYSSFRLGEDEFSYKTINNAEHTAHLARLASFVDEHTMIGIGSCYSGATFEKPAIGNKPPSRMNGDTLMIGVAKLFPGATVFGTEGWVMTKPGTFHSYSYALSGFPIQKRFKDEVYRPVWENMGVWNKYSTLTDKFERVNSLALTKSGSIHIKSVSYLEKEKYLKRQTRNLEKLEVGLVKLK